MLAEKIRMAWAQHGDRPMVQSGDHYWEERIGAKNGKIGPQRNAAVLVAFVDHPRPTLLLTRRTQELRNHSGQVAFPGGRIDPDDDGPEAAALREAQEEVGLPPAAVQLIVVTSAYSTVTNYSVTPVLAVIQPGIDLTPNPDEVARIFEVPIDIVFNPAHQQQKAVEWEGRMRHYFEIAHDGERIWGATAAMIRNLGVQLGLADAPDMWNRLDA
jgi:8-oxo-dGTP pyrophosphatase MutT (NUDIX family)